MTSPANGPAEACASPHLLNAFERASRALRTLSAGNRTLLRASDEQALLHDMCRVIVEKGGYRRAGVAYAEHDEAKTIRWMVWMSMGEGAEGEQGKGEEERGVEVFDISWLNASAFTWADTPLGQTAVGVTIRTGKPCIGRNLLTNPIYTAPAFAMFRKQAVEGGYAAVTAFPLLSDGVALGALFMAATEPDAFDDEEVRLLNELADDLAYGIANLRMREKHREAQATIARLAFYDPLTGLPNRTLLLEILKKAIHEAEERRHSLALLHLEVGRFQEINKVLGYRAGDELLRELGRRLAQSLEETESLARVGEVEFALLLPEASAEYAMQVAQRLTRSLREPIEVSGVAIDARVGIGIALFPDHATDAETLVRRANAAMHRTKPTSGCYAMYMGGQEQENTWRLSLMSDLHRAIEHNELQLYCQPKVEFASRRLSGAEALVRWAHPQQGMIAPDRFIKLAEQGGMITPLTHWMLEAAFSQSYAWQEAGLDQALSVNLSAHDLHDSLLIDRIQGLFSTWGIRPELIQFELTESALMDDPATALETLARLKRLGVQISIDDFGTGYSSLSYLQKFPVDAIKIDQSFVMPMVTSADSAVIVRSTIELGHNLSLKVIAEGVESQAVWESLEALGCDVAQGYLISMPMPTDQFKVWAGEWSKRSS